MYWNFVAIDGVIKNQLNIYVILKWKEMWEDLEVDRNVIFF
jgi:hypothetical protein